MKDQKNVRDFLTAALPTEIHQRLDFNDLKMDSTSYVEKTYQEHFTDLVIQTNFSSNNSQHPGKKPVDIYLLVEHKSSLPTAPHLQLLRYMIQIWERDQKNKQPLRPIIPIIFYHGKRKWIIPEEFHTILDTDPALRNYMPNFTFALFDLNENDWQKIIQVQENFLLHSAFTAMQQIHRNALNGLKQIVKAWENGAEKDVKEASLMVLNYIAAGSSVSHDQVQTTLSQHLVEGEKSMISLAEQWWREGVNEGMRQGIQQGIQQTKQEVKKLDEKRVIFLARKLDISLTQAKQLLAMKES